MNLPILPDWQKDPATQATVDQMLSELVLFETKPNLSVPCPCGCGGFIVNSSYP